MDINPHPALKPEADYLATAKLWIVHGPRLAEPMVAAGADIGMDEDGNSRLTFSDGERWRAPTAHDFELEPGAMRFGSTDWAPDGSKLTIEPLTITSAQRLGFLTADVAGMDPNDANHQTAFRSMFPVI